MLPELTTARRRTWGPNSAAFIPVQSLSPQVCWYAVMEGTTFSLRDDFCSNWAWAVHVLDQNSSARLSLEDLKAHNRQTDDYSSDAQISGVLCLEEKLDKWAYWFIASLLKHPVSISLQASFVARELLSLKFAWQSHCQKDQTSFFSNTRMHGIKHWNDSSCFSLFFYVCHS